MKRIDPLMESFVDHIASHIGQAVRKVLRDALSSAPKPALSAKGALAKKTDRGPHPRTLCYFPKCKNTAAPRYGMFCVADHKNLPKRLKNKIRAERKALRARPA